MVHQTVGRQLQVLQLTHLRHWTQLLNVVVAEPQRGQRGGGVDGGDIGQQVVGEAQAAQQGQALQAGAFCCPVV